MTGTVESSRVGAVFDLDGDLPAPESILSNLEHGHYDRTIKGNWAVHYLRSPTVPVGGGVEQLLLEDGVWSRASGHGQAAGTQRGLEGRAASRCPGLRTTSTSRARNVRIRRTSRYTPSAKFAPRNLDETRVYCC